jgi:small GTP-binding protein
VTLRNPGEVILLILYKIVLMGDGGVGKTAIRERYLGQGFKSQYLLTIGADFAVHNTEINGIPLRYQIWDLAGQQRFDAVREVFYRGAVSALLVYDVLNLESYYNIPKWINEYWENSGHGCLPLTIVANKIDMRELVDESISTEQGYKLTRELNKMAKLEGFECKFIETSARTGVNISGTFKLLGENILRLIEKKRIPMAHETLLRQNGD